MSYHLVRTLYTAFLLGLWSEYVFADDVKTIVFGGDTSHGESYQVEYARQGKSDVIAEKGYDHSFANVAPLLKKSDLAILNLETPLTSIRESPIVGKDYYHWSDPKQASESLKRLGIDAVSLANNHTMDYGAPALLETLEALRGVDIASFGAGADKSSADEPYLVDIQVGKQTIPVAVLGYFEDRKSYEEDNFYATKDRPGNSKLAIDDIRRKIAELRASKPELFIVVFPHWGRNYVWRSKKQQRLGHEIIDAGADLVIGHGAHCIQEVERYQDKWIVYSIGNFVFNSLGRYEKLNAPPYSMAAVLRIGEDSSTGTAPVLRLRFYPLVSDNRLTNYQPRWVTAEEFEEVYDLIEEHSSDEHLSSKASQGKDDVGHYFEIEL